jgi:transcriptional regulator with XRE-family HTH domain
MSDDATGFGALLRACRLAANLSQDELAERSGLTSLTISELERARTRSPHRDSVHRLADALDLRDAARAEFTASAGRRLAPAPPGTPGVPGQSGEDTPAGGRIVPQQLPAATRHFTGRERELAITRPRSGSWKPR